MPALEFSKRDKNLIYFCALFATGAITYMALISPLSDSIEKLAETKEFSQFQADSMRSEASMADIYEADLEDARIKYMDGRAVFYDVYATEEADRIFTDEVLSLGLTPVSFSISERNVEQKLQPYDFDEDVEITYSDFIYSRRVSFTCNGTFDTVMDYVDKLKDRYGVVIESVSLVNGDEEYNNINSPVEISVVFNIFTYDTELFDSTYDYDFLNQN